jgi:hypothetical protein
MLARNDHARSLIVLLSDLEFKLEADAWQREKS